MTPQKEAKPHVDTLKRGMKLIKQMKTDIVAAMTSGVPLVLQGPEPLKALLAVIDVAELATLKELIPFVGSIQAKKEEDKGWRCIVCVDFDGVLHSYTSGWKGPCDIPDVPVEGALEWLDTMTRYRDEKDQSFQVCIYSSRSRHEGAVQAMQEWLVKHGLSKETLELIDFPLQKPAASLMIDDRAFCFKGTFPEPKWILSFKPWNK